MNILSFQIHMRIKIATYNVLNVKINTNVQRASNDGWLFKNLCCGITLINEPCTKNCFAWHSLMEG